MGLKIWVDCPGCGTRLKVPREWLGRTLACKHCQLQFRPGAPEEGAVGAVGRAAPDWDDEVRLMLEERASFSPDALTAMEANLRFAGPETMETRIFGRLTAWQNWIFQRPNAVGEQGALRRYGTGQKAQFDMTRV